MDLGKMGMEMRQRSVTLEVPRGTSGLIVWVHSGLFLITDRED